MYESTYLKIDLIQQLMHCQIQPVRNIFLLCLWKVCPVKDNFLYLSRLKLWNCSSVTEERLSGLVMLLIHCESYYISSLEEIYQTKANWRVLKQINLTFMFYIHNALSL